MSSLANALSPLAPIQQRAPSPLPVAEDVEMDGIATDEDVVADEDGEPGMDDLFGNDDDVEKQDRNAATPEASVQESEELEQSEREHRKALEYPEEDIPGHISEIVKEANVQFPNIPVPKSSDGANWIIRMPNYVKVDSKPFHSETYMGPEHDEDEMLQGDNLTQKSMSIKLKVENTVRWRWIKDKSGTDQRQSNARIIRWSDGTLSLRLGKELFDIDRSIDTSAAVARKTIGGSQSQSQSQSQAPYESSSQIPVGKSQGLTYLVAQHKRAQVLQSEAVITGFMTLRPTGMQSETHRMLVRAVTQKHHRPARLRMAPDPTQDPEKEVAELLKLNAKKSKKKVVIDEDERLGSGRKRRHRRRTDRDMYSDDDEEDEHDGGFAGSEDEYESGHSRKKNRTNDEDKKDGQYQTDDFVVADSSEADSDAGGGGKRARDDRMEDDPLDEMEAKLKEQEDKRRLEREAQNNNVDGDADMEVESEEEDEEFKVRKQAPTSRKRRLEFDDDDE